MTKSAYHNYHLEGDILFLVKSVKRRVNERSWAWFYTFDARMLFGAMNSNAFDNYVVVNGVFSEAAWESLSCLHKELLAIENSSKTIMHMVAQQPRLEKPIAFRVKHGAKQGEPVPVLQFYVQRIVKARRVLAGRKMDWHNIEAQEMQATT